MGRHLQGFPGYLAAEDGPHNIVEEEASGTASTPGSTHSGNVLGQQEEEILVLADGGYVHGQQEEELPVPDDGGNVHGQQEEEIPVLDDDIESLLNQVYQIDIPVIHHYAQEKACNYQGKNIQFGFEKHIMPCNSVEMPHQCPHCEHRTVELSNLLQHVMAHHNGEPHQCPHCEYKADHLTNLKQHIMARHTREMPHNYPYCEYKTIQKGDLKQHVMAHNIGEKPHRCPYCEYKSVIRLHVLNHHIMARHTGSKPHQCPNCEYKSVQKGGYFHDQMEGELPVIYDACSQLEHRILFPSSAWISVLHRRYRQVRRARQSQEPDKLGIDDQCLPCGELSSETPMPREEL
nr:zinc finger Y-chromosomal protein 2-like [Halyomorpha halys]